MRRLSLSLLILAACGSTDDDGGDLADASSGDIGAEDSSSAADTAANTDPGTGDTTTTEGDSESGDDSESDGDDSDDSGEPPPPPPTMTPGCGMAPTGDVLDGVITVRDVERTYLIEIPADYDPEIPYPLIFGFHGDSGDSSNAQNGYRLFDHYKGQAIVVYPDGSGAGGSPSWDTAAGGSDVEMVMAIAQEIGLEMCFDLNRVHAFGFSRGGIMSNAMGCYRGDFFTGIGAASASAPSTGLCQGPVAVHLSHGEMDSTISFASGTSARDGWLGLNGCSEETIPVEPEGCVEYQGCEPGAPVVWCQFPGAHSFNGTYAEAAVALFESL